MMSNSINLEQDTKTSMAMHPKKFALWLFIVSIVMIFAALTSAYIVRQGEGDWLDFQLPTIFWINTFIVVLSSISMHWAYISAKRDNLHLVKLALSITVALGITFLVAQFLGWGEMVDMDVYFVGNPSGSFLYVFTGLHAFHLISGIVFLTIILVSAFKFKVHSKNMTRIEMCTTYWHFLSGLWIYLFFFLLINH